MFIRGGGGRGGGGGTDYIGETVRNAQLCWNQHENGTAKNSECAWLSFSFKWEW